MWVPRRIGMMGAQARSCPALRIACTKVSAARVCLSCRPSQSSVSQGALRLIEGIRAQIRDLRTENIAKLAVRARSSATSSRSGMAKATWSRLPSSATPPRRRSTRRLTFYIPDMRGYAPAQRGAVRTTRSRLHGKPIADSRSTTDARRHAGALPGARAARRCRHQRRLCRAAMAQHPQRHPPDRRRAAPFALDFDGDWKLDLDRLFATCDARTRAIFLSTPSNPTGWTATREEMEALLDFSRRTGIWIISDEVYNRLYFDGDVAPSILQIAEDGDRVLLGQQLFQGLGDDRLAARLADASVGRRRPARRHDAIRQQRHGRRHPGGGGRGDPTRASRWSPRSGSASRPASTSPMSKLARDAATSSCRQSRAAACMPSSRCEGESDARGLAPTFSKRRMSAWRRAICSAACPNAFIRMCVCREPATDRHGARTACLRMIEELTPAPSAALQHGGGKPPGTKNASRGNT